MIKFGPSGCDVLFFEEGHNHFYEMPQWLSEKFRLTAAEYAFNFGVNVTDDMAKKIGERAKEYGVEITAHAPYYINYGNPDETAEYKAHAYIINSLKKLALMGGKRLCVHLGSVGKLDREYVLNLIENRLKNLSKLLDEHNLNDVMICFEAMGKYSQIGTYEEVAKFASIDPRFNVTLDFGHINCILQGGLKAEEDYQKIFDYLFSVLPESKVKSVHIHFSHIEFGAKGEIKHHTLAEEEFGPPFQPLANVLKANKIDNAVIICESKQIMAQDAEKLKKIFENTI